MGVIECGYNTPPTFKTPEQLAVWSKWRGLHPEMKRRLMALIVDSGYVLGVGGAFRSAAEQIALWNSRYDRVDYWTRYRWDGSYWIHVSGAAAGMPGDSYHEPCLGADNKPDDSDATGFCVAVDTLNLADLPDNSDAFLALYGLRNFDQEPWHVQSIEWPAARATWDKNPIPLKTWALPIRHAPKPEVIPPTTTEELTMIALDHKPDTPEWTAYCWTGTELSHIFDGHADNVLRRSGVKRQSVTDDELLGIIRSSETMTAAPSTLTTAMKLAWG